MIRGTEDIYDGVPPDFTHFLIDSFGVPDFLEFYATARSDGTSEGLETAFTSAFGVSLGEVVSSWAALPSNDRGDARLGEQRSQRAVSTRGRVRTRNVHQHDAEAIRLMMTSDDGTGCPTPSATRPNPSTPTCLRRSLR